MENSKEISVISNKADIMDYMREIADKNTPLTIFTTRTDIYKKYQTSIISIDEGKNLLALRALSPHDWQDYFGETESVKVSYHLQDAEITFITTLLQSNDSEGNTTWQLPLPEHINKMQLRNFLRASLLESPSKVNLETKDNRKFEGICMNISLSGTLLQLNSATAYSQIKLGDLIEKNHLVIDDMLDITYSAKVCHVQRDSLNSVLIGFKFIDLRLHQLNAISTAIAKVDRLNAKKKANIPLH